MYFKEFSDWVSANEGNKGSETEAKLTPSHITHFSHQDKKYKEEMFLTVNKWKCLFVFLFFFHVRYIF